MSSSTANPHPRGSEAMANYDSYSSDTRLGPLQRTVSPSSSTTIKASSKGLDRSSSNASTSSASKTTLASSSDRTFNTLKHLASGIKHKGRKHLRIKSESTPVQLPSQSLLSLPVPASAPGTTGSSSSSAITFNQSRLYRAAHQQTLLIDSFSKELAVSPPPAPPSSFTSPSSQPLRSSHSLDSPRSPTLAVTTSPSATSPSSDAPVRRRPSFRHENYPRKHLHMQAPPPSSQQEGQSTAASPPPLGSDVNPNSTYNSVPSPEDLLDITVPALLQQGTPMLKVSAKKTKTRVFRLDADLGQIQWESKKSGVIIIENIKEIRSGPETRYYREQFRIPADKEPLWITIVYTTEAKYKTLHLVAFTPDVFRLWNTTLRRLFAFRQDLLSGLGSMERKDDVWERQYWKDTDTSGDHRADFDEIERMCRRLNISSSRADLLNVFMEADSLGRGYLEFADFKHFVALLKARPDINALFVALKGNLHDHFSFVVFEHFMRTCQHSEHTRAQLVKLFDKYAPRDDISPPPEPVSLGEKPNAGVSSTTAAAIGTSNITLSSPPDAAPMSPGEQPSSSSAPEAISTAAAATGAPEADHPPSPETASLLAPPSPLPSWRSPSPPESPLPGPSAELASPSHDGSSTPPRDPNDPTLVPTAHTWSLSSFAAFLLSSDNSPFSPADSSVTHDMTRPLAEYFISSSHNTYLIGHQLVGDSTVEGYIRALLHGCRSVELDIWDGEDGPAIYHGRTLTSKVPLADVARAIARYAFVASPYPIIISAEVHCSLKQQDQAAEIMKREFGDMLVMSTLDGEETIEALPSPERLKHRILLKAKNLYATQDGKIQTYSANLNAESSATEESSADASDFDTVKREFKSIKSEFKGVGSEMKQEFGLARNLIRKAKDKIKDTAEPAKTKGQAGDPSDSNPSSPPKPSIKDKEKEKDKDKDQEKVKMSISLAALIVYTVGVKCRGFNKKEHYAIEHVFSLSERTANKILKESMGDLVKHNRSHVVRVYPNGTRLSSSNYEPHRYWASGTQLVAINWQTFDLGYIMNYAMFQRNGKSGYVLKPDALRIKDKELNNKRTKHFLDITIISAQQLPRPKLIIGKDADTRYTIDPYVEVSVHVPDWSTSPFLPSVDETPSVTVSTYSPPRNSGSGGASGASGNPTGDNASTARTISHVTSVVKNNGWNPVWQERMSIPFDCVGDMKDLIFVKLQVKDEYNGEEIALFCAPLGSLRPGFRHLPLHDKQLSQFLFSSLFVQINIRDVTD